MHTKYVELGRITQARGLKGYVVAHIDLPLTSLDTVDYIFVKINHTPVPYRVVQSTLQNHQALLKFQNIDDRLAAQELTGKSLCLPAAILDTLVTQATQHPLIGYQVTDMHQGSLGSVKRIEQFPLHTCLVVDYLSHELLIPYEAALIQHIDHDRKHLLLQLPAGFLEAVGYK